MNLFRYKQQRRALTLEQVKKQLGGRLIALQMHAGKAADAVERKNFEAFTESLEDAREALRDADKLTPRGF